MCGRYGRRADKKRNAEWIERLHEQGGDILVQQEILSRPDNSKKPIRDQEFYELRINDWTESWQPGYAVIQWRTKWSEVDQQFMWEDEQAEHWPTLDCAKNRYERRLRELKKRGFVHSDMDF